MYREEGGVANSESSKGYVCHWWEVGPTKQGKELGESGTLASITVACVVSTQ